MTNDLTSNRFQLEPNRSNYGELVCKELCLLITFRVPLSLKKGEKIMTYWCYVGKDIVTRRLDDLLVRVNIIVGMQKII